MTPCLIWCLTAACTAITWNPVPDPDVAFYRVRDQGGNVVAEAPCCHLNVPEGPILSLSVAAVDLGGLESVVPTVLPWGEVPCDGWGDGPCLEMDCTGGCRQRKRGNPERKHYCEAWEVRP